MIRAARLIPEQQVHRDEIQPRRQLVKVRKARTRCVDLGVDVQRPVR